MLKFFSELVNRSDNISEVTSAYASTLNFPVTKSSLVKAIAEHPDYPSMLAINDVFRLFGAETFAVRVEKPKLRELDQPYITQIRLHSRSELTFTIVKPKDSESVFCLHPEENRWIAIKHDEMMHMSNGTVFMAEIGEGAGESKYKQKLVAERKKSANQTVMLISVPMLVVGAITLSLLRNGAIGAFYAVYLSLATFGSLAGLILLLYEVDRNNPILKQVCGNNESRSCTDVLESGASKVFGLKWSVVGFSYFVGITMTLLITGDHHLSVMQLLGWLSILALIYAAYSLYYQWKVVKKWCVLCLLIQIILVLQALIVLSAGWAFLPFSGFPYFEVISILASFTLPFIASQLTTQAFRRAAENRLYAIELQRLKHDPNIFKTLLEKQASMNDAQGLGIQLGNPSAKYRITKVCNPYCDPCAKSHSTIDEILKDNPDVQVQIIFTASDDDRDIKSAPVRHFLALSDHLDEPAFKQALDHWYQAQKKDYPAFAANYPLNGELLEQGSRISAMRTWCNQMDILFTPTIFINGHKLPDIYSIDNLKFILRQKIGG